MGLNALDNNSQKKQIAESKARSIEILNRNLLSNAEIEQRINEVGRSYNTVINDNINNSAYSYNNFLNPDLIKTLSVAKMSGQKAAAEIQVRNQLYSQNANINNQIAQIEANTPINPNGVGSMIADSFNIGSQLFAGLEQNDLSRQAIEDQKNYLNNKSTYVENNSNMFSNVKPTNLNLDFDPFGIKKYKKAGLFK